MKPELQFHPEPAELYRLLVEELHGYAIFVINRGGVITTWNPGVQQILGYRQEEFIGLQAATLFTPKDREKGVHTLEVEAARKHGRAQDVRWHLRQDGSLVFVDGVLHALRSPEGEILAFAKIMRDVTPGHGIGGLIQTILDATDQPIFVKDLEGRYAFANSAVAGMFGCQAEEVIGKRDSELQPGRLSQQIEEHDCRVIQSGQTETVEETVFVRGQGETTYLTTKAPWRGSEGRVAGVVGIAQNIHDRKQTEAERERLYAELRETQGRLRAVMEQMPSGLIMAEAPSGRILTYSVEAERLLGHPIYPCSDYHGYTSYGAEHEDGSRYDVEEYPTAKALLRDETVRQEHMLYRRGDGQLVHLSVNAAPVKDGEQTVAVVCTFHDITEQKRTEAELARSNEDLLQFAHVVSHDLQAPLRMVKSYAQLLARRYQAQGNPDATTDEFIRTISDGVDRMEQLTRGLLQLAEVGEGSGERTSIRVETVVDGVLVDLRPIIEECRAEIVCGELPVIIADRMQLLQLFGNLLGNALKYGHPKRACRISVTAEKRSGEYLFAITDNGIGIEERHREIIFAPLKRLHGKNIPGTGIGLAVCRKIVERHGGRIWVESQPGRGSTFFFTLADR